MLGASQKIEKTDRQGKHREGKRGGKGDKGRNQNPPATVRTSTIQPPLGDEGGKRKKPQEIKGGTGRTRKIMGHATRKIRSAQKEEWKKKDIVNKG